MRRGDAQVGLSARLLLRTRDHRLRKGDQALAKPVLCICQSRATGCEIDRRAKVIDICD